MTFPFVGVVEIISFVRLSVPVEEEDLDGDMDYRITRVVGAQNR